MSKTAAVEINTGTELFKGEQPLVLKKVERRKSANDVDYFMMFFNQCVKYDELNPRNSRYIDVPYYISAELAMRIFTGVKFRDLIDKTFHICVEYSPSLQTSGKNEKFASHKAEIIDIVCLDDLPRQFKDDNGGF